MRQYFQQTNIYMSCALTVASQTNLISPSEIQLNVYDISKLARMPPMYDIKIQGEFWSKCDTGRCNIHVVHIECVHRS